MVRSLKEYEAWLSFMEQRKTRIKELYLLQGKGQHQIARIIGISQPGIRKHLARMNLLIPKNSTSPDGVPLPITLKEGEFIKVEPGGYSWGKPSLEIGRCERCRGFFIRGYTGMRFCCDACGSSNPCTCGTCKRGKVVIS
ncbi:MAG: hypothetical protein A3G93_08485 [Nitrospinae bacterium RIFCSPLOWO2_12_FULL_45_22]|nr:MAG: hypothetical protein A3G93_08485 [Nitrospinae bacterium RIFCSPLOWO2_12_FULL_45_22]